MQLVNCWPKVVTRLMHTHVYTAFAKWKNDRYVMDGFIETFPLVLSFDTNAAVDSMHRARIPCSESACRVDRFSYRFAVWRKCTLHTDSPFLSAPNWALFAVCT